MATDPNALAEQVLSLVGDRAEAQVRATRRRNGLTRFANSAIHQHVGEDVTSLELLVVRDGRVLQLATTRTDPDTLAGFVDHAVEALGQAPVDATWPGFAPDEPQPDTTDVEPDPDATPEARAEVVAAFVDADRGGEAAGYCETLDEDVVLAATTGRVRRGRATRATVDGILRTPTSAGSGHMTGHRLAELDGAAAGADAAGLARRGEDPGDVEPGRYEVVLSPEAVATIAVFLGVYGFNARAVAEGRAPLAPGDASFDPAFGLVSDPTDARALDLPFDHEGTDRVALPLVIDGRVAGLAHDRRTAAATDTASTGSHGPWSARMGPVPTSLFVAPGTSSPEQLVGDVERGLLVTAFNYCRVLDGKSLVVTGLTRNGTFLVEDGRVMRPLGNLRFTQSFTAAVAPGAVLGVGDDARHADAEFGPGLAHVPSLRLASLNVTGGQSG